LRIQLRLKIAYDKLAEISAFAKPLNHVNAIVAPFETDYVNALIGM